MEVTVKLNGVKYDEQVGFNSLTERLYFSKELRGYLKEVKGEITFIEDAYNYLRELFIDGICSQVDVEFIVNNRSINGRIVLVDCEWNPPKRKVKCEVIDNSYTSNIFNNRKIKAFMNVGRSKNDVEFTPVLQTDCTFVDPNDANPVTNRKGVRIFDALDFLIQFVSDGAIRVASDYLNPNYGTTNAPYLTIFTGNAIRTGSADYAYASLFDVLGDIAKLRNLEFGIEVSGGVTYFRIEPASYFKQSSNGTVIENVNDYFQEVNRDLFYSKVIFGSAQEDDKDFTYLQNIRFQSFRKEEYHLGGQCNIDNELNLECDTFITDTNIIQDILPVAQGGTDNDQYDDDIFLVQLDSNNKVVLTLKPASATDYYFNESLTNRAVSLFWFGSIPQSIYAYLGEGNDGCLATLTVDQSIDPTYDTAACNDDSSPPNNDVNGNYTVGSTFNGYTNTVAGYYTAPSNNVFNINFSGRFTGLLSQVQIRRISGTTTLQIQELYTGNLIDQVNYLLIEGGATFYMNAGEIALVVFILSDGTLHSGATFEVADPLGGTWTTYEVNDTFFIQNNFEYDIDDQTWQQIIDSPYSRMRFTHVDGVTDGWIDEVERTLIDGGAQFKLSSNSI